MHSGSRLDECVIMGGVEIGRDVQLKRVIVEEGACIPDGTRLGDYLGLDAERFKVTEGGILIVPRRAPLKQREEALAG